MCGVMCVSMSELYLWKHVNSLQSKAPTTHWHTSSTPTFLLSQSTIPPLCSQKKKKKKAFVLGLLLKFQEAVVTGSQCELWEYHPTQAQVPTCDRQIHIWPWTLDGINKTRQRPSSLWLPLACVPSPWTCIWETNGTVNVMIVSCLVGGGGRRAHVPLLIHVYIHCVPPHYTWYGCLHGRHMVWPRWLLISTPLIFTALNVGGVLWTSYQKMN